MTVPQFINGSMSNLEKGYGTQQPWEGSLSDFELRKRFSLVENTKAQMQRDWLQTNVHRYKCHVCLLGVGFDVAKSLMDG